MNNPQVINAAVAILWRQDGAVLLAKRPEGKPWAGWWEFPGGKVESGETPQQALVREIEEELGTRVLTATPWLTRTFAYPDKTVKLHFFMVRQWAGEPHGREGQTLSWQHPSQCAVEPMLPANAPILQALSLPTLYAITDLAEHALAIEGEAQFFARMQRALQAGLRLIQVREKHMSPSDLKAFSRQVIALAHPYGAHVLLNGDPKLATEVGASGVHLPSEQLMALTQKPAGLMCAASCHNQQELAHAQQLGLDFVVCSPVLPTQSHPHATTLGWQGFAAIISERSIPVYALGGLSPQHLTTAWQHGAHGIAMQRAIWRMDETT